MINPDDIKVREDTLGDDRNCLRANLRVSSMFALNQLDAMFGDDYEAKEKFVRQALLRMVYGEALEHARELRMMIRHEVDWPNEITEKIDEICKLLEPLK